LASAGTIQCVYCGTPQNTVPARRPTSILKQILYSPARESTSSFLVNCQCGKSYTLTLIGDREYWRKNIIFRDEDVLRDTMRLLNDDDVTFNRMIDSLIGIARFENGTTHACFLICSIRGYYDCEVSERILVVISVNGARV